MGRSNMMLARAIALFGTAGQVAATKMFRLRDEDTAAINQKWLSTGVVRLVEKSLASGEYHMGEELSVKLPTAEFTADILARAMDKVAVGGLLTFGDPTAGIFKNLFSFALLGDRSDGTPVRLDIPYACAGDGTDTAFDVSKFATVPMEIHALDPDENTGALKPSLLIGAGDINKTIASGTFARTQSWHRLAGEGAAADALTDITGASLTEGEIITLQIQSTAQPITVTPGASLISLTPSDAWTMTNLADFTRLKYLTTTWTEIERYMAPR